MNYPGVRETSGLLPFKSGSYTIGNFKNDTFCETDSLSYDEYSSATKPSSSSSPFFANFVDDFKNIEKLMSQLVNQICPRAMMAYTQALNFRVKVH